MRSIADKYSMTPGVGVVVYDPVTLTAVSIGATMAGGAISAAGTLAGGSFAKTAGQMQKASADYQADQLEQNATQAIASGQRTMLDTQEKARLATSSLKARAGASGVDAGVGSPLADEGEIAQRGSYHALMDMFNGESTATGLRNQAKGVRYTGELDEMGGDEAKEASYFSAAGTLAGSAGSALSTYGRYTYPTARGPSGVSVG